MTDATEADPTDAQSDQPPIASEDPAPAAASQGDEPRPSPTRGRFTDDVVGMLEWGALIVSGLVALVAFWRFYASTTDAIATFVDPEYEPLFQAGFNLIVLFAAGVAISVLVRRRAGTSDRT